MDFCEHCQLMASYNLRMNRQLYDAASSLPKHVLDKNLGAFFRSIIGTFNHLVVADIIWLTRFAEHRQRYESLQKVSRYPQPAALNDILYDDFLELRKIREELDGLLIYWLTNEVEEPDFSQTLSYSNTKGIRSTRNFGELLSHFFNHQTHHRGQLTTLFAQLDIDVGITDFLIDIPDQTPR